MKKSFLYLIFIFSYINASQNDTWFTIFVHGTFCWRNNLTVHNFYKLLKDKIEDTEYSHKIEAMRNDSYYYNLQPIQEQGLKRIDNLQNSHIGPFLFSALFNYIQTTTDNTVKNLCYTYGWSGLLSAKRRLKDSENFYIALKNEIETFYKNYNYYPKIRLIGYSHGGTVCLNLAQIRKDIYTKDNFCLDELILLATPVQELSYNLINEQIFKKIYHIYSPSDRIQRLDIFSPSNFISHKKFRKNKGILPEKLTQIKVYISQSIRNNSRTKICRSPGHMELWFFGWAPNFYRKCFPFYPMPFAIFIPFIIDNLKKHSPHSKKVRILIRPDKAIMEIKTEEQIQEVQFFDKQELQKLCNKALEFHPHKFYINPNLPCSSNSIPLIDQHSLFAELLNPVFPQIKQKDHNGKTVDCFSKYDEDLKNNA